MAEIQSGIQGMSRYNSLSLFHGNEPARKRQKLNEAPHAESPRLMQIYMQIEDNFDPLELGGLLKVFSSASDEVGNCLCTPIVTSESPCISQRIGGTKTATDTRTQDLVYKNIDKIDVLVLLGRKCGVDSPEGFGQEGEKSGPELLLRHFIKHSQSEEYPEKRRYVLAIDEGVLLAARAGLLLESVATTSRRSLGKLQSQMDRSGCGGKAVKARYIDSGYDEVLNMHTITSGGSSCAIDAALYLLELVFGEKVAARTARRMDYVWQKETLPVRDLDDE